MKGEIKSKVYVVKTGDRKVGVSELLKKFAIDKLSGKKVALKANYNSSDPFPASTHIDTLSIIVEELKKRNSNVVMAERSGMGNTKTVLEDTGVISLAERIGFDVIVLDDLKSREWVREKGDHWNGGKVRS